MKGNKWLFLGTDARLAACSEIMAQRGFDTYHIGTDHYTDDLGNRIAEYSPRQIVFPILQMKGSIPFELMEKETQLYTGITSEEWQRPLKEAGLLHNPYLKEEQFIWQNAKLTAEGFIHEFYSRTRRSVFKTHFYVAGFGKVGKAVTHALASLGANVTVIARSDAQLGEASFHGYKTERLTDEWGIKDGNLVNTIPAKWLSVSESPGLHIFDLASEPGCLKEQLSSEYYTVLLGLPGKHFPVDAAAALANALERMYRR
jgi:dipicolinate synthase subunit A